MGCQLHEAFLRNCLKRFQRRAAQNETLPAPVTPSFALMHKQSFGIHPALLRRAATSSLAKKAESWLDSLQQGLLRVVPRSISRLHSAGRTRRPRAITFLCTLSTSTVADGNATAFSRLGELLRRRSCSRDSIDNLMLLLEPSTCHRGHAGHWASP